MTTDGSNSTAGRDIGVRNQQGPYGLAHLVLASVLLLLWLGRYAIPGSLAFGPTENKVFADLIDLLVHGWIYISAAIVCVTIVVHGWIGLHAIGAVAPQANVPAPILHEKTAVSELLLNKSIIDTYPFPESLFAKFVRRLLPKYFYMTPAGRRPAGGLLRDAAGLVLLTSFAYWFAGIVGLWIAGAFALSLAGRLIALWSSSIEASGGDQEFQKYLTRGVRELHPPRQLSHAGDPRSLYHEARRLLLEELRFEQLQNRALNDQSPQIGEGTTNNSIKADLLVETQPLASSNGRGTMVSAMVLDVAAVLVGVLGWSLWLYAHRFPSLTQFLAGMLSWLVCMKLYSDLFNLAGTAHNTYRFRSALFWIEFDGNCQKTVVGIGGEMGPISSKREGFSSGLHLRVRGTTVITECRPSTTRFNQACVSALHSPRYIVSAPRDRGFGSRFEFVVARLSDHRDNSHKLIAPTMETEQQQLEYLRSRQQHLSQQADYPGRAITHQQLGEVPSPRHINSEIISEGISPDNLASAPPRGLPSPPFQGFSELDSNGNPRQRQSDEQRGFVDNSEPTDDELDDFDPNEWKL